VRVNAWQQTGKRAAEKRTKNTNLWNDVSTFGKPHNCFNYSHCTAWLVQRLHIQTASRSTSKLETKQPARPNLLGLLLRSFDFMQLALSFVEGRFQFGGSLLGFLSVKSRRTKCDETSAIWKSCWEI